jgi:cell division GTPase FtsZ
LQVAIRVLISQLAGATVRQMTNITDIREMNPRIIVFGVGGAGGNAVTNMIAAGLQGVDFIAANTDAQALIISKGQVHHPVGHPGGRMPMS